MREALVADFTRAFQGKLEEALGKVGLAIDRFKIEQRYVLLVGREDQQHEAQHLGRWYTATEETAISTIDAILASLAKEVDRPDLVTIASYNVTVLSRYGALRADSDLRISSVHFSSLKTKPELHPSLHPPIIEGEKQLPETSGQADGAEQQAHQTRSSRVEAVIRDHGYGPYSAIRQRIYDEMENAVSSSSGKSLREFVWECAMAVKSSLPEESTRESSRYDWKRVRDTVIKILTEAQVILGADGASIPGGPQGRLAVVGSFQPDWQVKADAELAMVAIENLGDICEYDYPVLAGALYHARTPDAEDRVAGALAALQSQGRVRQVHEGGVSYLRPSSTPSEARERYFSVVKA